MGKQSLAVLAMAVAWVAALAIHSRPANGQNGAPAPGQNFQNAPAAPLLGPQAPFGGPVIGAGPGGAANADFDSLIDLIVSTVATETWAENGGGDADVRPFPGGVMVDATGMLRLQSERSSSLESILKHGQAPVASARSRAQVPAMQDATFARDVCQPSMLRFISLPRLEHEIARRLDDREPLEPAMLTLAGLQRVRYVLAYPETGDLVLAGPAGDWQVDDQGHIVSTENGAPVVRLDDLLVLLRRASKESNSFFGCSINPRQEALAQTQSFLAASGAEPLKAGQSKRWLDKLRDTVGLQDIEIFGIDPTSRVAGVLIGADYHMKLIGMGLEEGVDGVDSYLDSIRLARGEAPPSMSVLRWWFALHYDEVRASAQRNAFELVGQGVRVLSENEMLAERGQRIHTGKSDALNRRFAESFTTHFDELVARYPVYGELRNIFDLAMATTIIADQRLAEQVGWEPSLFASDESLRLPVGPVPRQVETVIAHRVFQRKYIVAGVSGGVMVAPGDVLEMSNSRESHTISRPALAVDEPAGRGSDRWWWDLAE